MLKPEFIGIGKEVVEALDDLGGGLRVVGLGKKYSARIQISDTGENDLGLSLWCRQIWTACFA
jgi:hypothetical protein